MATAGGEKFRGPQRLRQPLMVSPASAASTPLLGRFGKNQFQTVGASDGLRDTHPESRHERALDEADPGCGKPERIVADAEIYSTYESGLQENQRYADAKLGSLGFETLKYKSAPLVFDGTATGLRPELTTSIRNI